MRSGRAWLPEPTTEVGPERRAWLPEPTTEVGPEAAAVHMALVMVRSGPRGSAAVRLVQDFGRGDAPDAVAQTATALPAAVTAAPPSPKRSRGRPPGSRTRKNGTLTTMSVN